MVSSARSRARADAGGVTAKYANSQAAWLLLEAGHVDDTTLDLAKQAVHLGSRSDGRHLYTEAAIHAAGGGLATGYKALIDA